MSEHIIDLNQVVAALRNVIDPASGQDLVKAKLVSNLKTEGTNVFFELDVTHIKGEVRTSVYMASEQAITGAIPGAQVHIHMKSAEPNQPAYKSVLPQVKNVIAVASGKGGVGKSTVSVNLAIALQNLGAKVGLLDADLYGPSIPTMLGIQDVKPKIKEVYGKHKIIPVEVHGIHTISIGLIVEPEKAVVLRGPRLSGVIKQFINDCIWPELDYLIVDLPPGTGDIQLTLVQSVPVTGVIMVTTPQKVAVVDAVKAMNMFLLSNINVPVLGVVENMSYFTPKELPDSKYFIFGEGGGKQLAKLSRSILLGQVPLVQEIREGGDAGTPSATVEDGSIQKVFADIAGKTAQQIYIRNETLDPTKIVTIK